MNIFLDNTGLHSVGRCLEGQGVGEVDIKGLLQFATELIFSQNISISSFETEDIQDRSELIKVALAGAGLASKTIRIKPYTSLEYAEACERAADRFSEDFKYIFPEVSLPIGMDPKALTVDLRTNAHLDYVHSLVKQEWGPHHLEEIASTALNDKATGSVAYILSNFPSLWKRVRRAAKMPEWTLRESG